MRFLRVAIFSTRATATNGGTLGNSSNLNVGNVGFVARDPNNGWHVFFIQYRPIVPRKTAQQRGKRRLYPISIHQ